MAVRERRPEANLKIEITASPDLTGLARVHLLTSLVKIVLDRNQLGALTKFFLVYYRDGAAEVDHLDLNAIQEGNKHKKSMYLTFRVADSKPSVSPEEAKKRLGL